MLSNPSLRRLAGATLAASLLTPAIASADTSVVGGPLKVRAYQMSVLGSDNGAKDSLTVMFNRAAGGSNQMHMYTFEQGVTVTPTSIKAKLGAYGAIDLELVGATKGRGVVPKGCTGNPGTTKNGTLQGSFRLVADKTYFKTITAKSMKGSTQSGGKLNCQGSGGGQGGGNGAGGPRLSLFAQGAGSAMTTFSADAKAQSVMVMDDAAATGPATIMHSITAEGRGLDVAGDRSTATVPAVGPFMGGSGRYEGEAFSGGSSGTLGGSLVAKFDSIGAVDLRGDASIS